MKKKKRKIIKRTFNIIFFTTITCFVIFLYLFATRVTASDIQYFIEQSKESTNEFIQSIKQKKETKILKKTESYKITKPEIRITTNDTTDHNDVILESDILNLVYYSQTDDRWNDTIYGADDTIGVYGCGPTTLAMIISTLTDNIVTPDTMAKWSYDNGYFCNNSGSYHSLIPKGVNKHGLVSKSLESPTKQTIIDELSSGNLIVVLMNKGTFTSEGHFIVLRGITNDSQVLIADSKSLDNSQKPWDIDLILKEAKLYANNGGPFWSISKQ